MGSSRRGFYFWKINISGILRHAHFGKSVHFLNNIFGHFPDDAAHDDAPTIFLSGQSPMPLRAGIKYRVRASLTSIFGGNLVC